MIWSAALQTISLCLNLNFFKLPATLCEASSWLAICVLVMALTSNCLHVFGSVIRCKHSRRAIFILMNAANSFEAQFTGFRPLCIVKASEMEHGCRGEAITLT